MKITKQPTNDEIIEWWQNKIHTTHLSNIIELIKQFYEDGDSNITMARKIYNSQQK